MHLISKACFFTNLFEFVLLPLVCLSSGFIFSENFDSRFKLMKHCFGLFRLVSVFRF
jgi:hypothetical protein